MTYFFSCFNLLDGGMITLLYLGYVFLPSVWFLSLTGGFFLPQIVHNVIRGQRYKFDSVYIFLLRALRIAIPVSSFKNITYHNLDLHKRMPRSHI